MIGGVKVKDLKVVPADRGMRMEMFSSDDPDFQRFGQVYMTVFCLHMANGTIDVSNLHSVTANNNW